MAAICTPCWASGWWPRVSERIFESQVAANRPAMLGDHKIQDVVIMPGSAYLEMALAASAAAARQALVVCAGHRWSR